MNVIIGVPAYGGSVRIEFTLRLVATVIALLHAGHEVDVIYTASESLIPRARNSIATKALATKFTHLLWIDADSVFDPKDILCLLDAAKPIVALPYAIKFLDWQAIAEAARLGVPPGELAAAGTTSVGKNGLACGTGTMLVERRVFEAMAAQLRSDGIEVKLDAEVYPNGRFARIHDPEGNPVELWEPKSPQ